MFLTTLTGHSGFVSELAMGMTSNSSTNCLFFDQSEKRTILLELKRISALVICLPASKVLFDIGVRLHFLKKEKKATRINAQIVESNGSSKSRQLLKFSSMLGIINSALLVFILLILSAPLAVNFDSRGIFLGNSISRRPCIVLIELM